MAKKELKPRLKVVEDWILTNNFQKVIDVGVDHGYLAFNLAIKNPKITVWVTDVVPTIIAKLKKKTAAFPQIIALCQEGIPSLQETVDLLTITGLGVEKIHQIVKHHSVKIKNYLFQTNHNPSLLRKWIQKKAFYLQKEIIIEEKNHFYHTLFINTKEGKKIKTKREIFFGPLHLEKQSPAFIHWWTKELNQKEKLLPQISQIKKWKKMEREVTLIKAVLTNREKD